jgi:hypothetical protein
LGDLLIFSNLTGASQDFSLNCVGNTGFNGLQIVSSPGASIGIQFWLDQGNGYDLHTPAPVNLKAGVVAQTNWNTFITGYQGGNYINVYSNLIYSAGGTVNPLSVTVSGESWSQPCYFGSGDPNQVGDSDLAGGSVLAVGSTDAYIGITNIPYSQYDIYVYLANEPSGNQGTCTIGSSSTGYYTLFVGDPNVLNGDTSSEWITLTATNAIYADYLEFTNLTGSSQTIKLTVPSNGGINGFQIVSAAAVPPSPVKLSISYANGNVTLSWSNPAYELESASIVNGHYTVVTGAASPYTVPASGGQTFYRLYKNSQ